MAMSAPNTTRNTPQRLHHRQDVERDSTEGSDEEGSSATFKSQYACKNCKRLKVKCEFLPGLRTCKRCQITRVQCLPRERKKRPPAPSQNELQQRSNEMSRKIESIMNEIDAKRRDAAIYQMLSKLEPERSERLHFLMRSGNGELQHSRLAGTGAELAARRRFSAAKIKGHDHVLRILLVPDIVKFCELYPDEITELFHLYFERVNVFFSILDRDLHTPERLIWFSPFLFTVICAVASKYYTKRPALHPIAMGFAMDAAGKALYGAKSVDVCQAYLLMAVYPVLKKHADRDNSWLLMGVAIKFAIELGLNQEAPPMLTEQEKLNRTRTWLNCYCVDLSHAIQYGKMPILRVDDYVAQNSRNWYNSSPNNLPIDIHLCAYVEMLSIAAEFHTEKQRQGESIEKLAIKFEKRLGKTRDFWVSKYQERMNDPVCKYRSYTSQMIAAYLQLTFLSAGFQEANRAGRQNPSIIEKSVEAGESVIRRMTRDLHPMGYLKFAMPAHFFFAGFASAFLVNLCRPRLASLLDESSRQRIVSLVEELIKILQSSDVALDVRHAPAVYSRFLSGLLAKYKLSGQGAKNRPSSTPADPDQVQPTADGLPADQMWPNHWDSWPCLPQSTTSDAPISPDYEQQGELDMDLTTLHFMQTVSNQGTMSDTYLNDDPSSWESHHLSYYQTRFSAPWSHLDAGTQGPDWL